MRLFPPLTESFLNNIFGRIENRFNFQIKEIESSNNKMIGNETIQKCDKCRIKLNKTGDILPLFLDTSKGFETRQRNNNIKSES